MMKPCFEILILAITLLAAAPSRALAYLDPSAGNALVYVAVTLISVVAFAVKGLYYRVSQAIRREGRSVSKGNEHDAIALFSEGRNYWSTFQPVVDALLEKGQPFSYYTMDVKDPALRIRNPLMKSRYLGDGSAASARLNRVSANVMLATTPNIGTPGFPVGRPARVRCLAHVFHAPAGVAYYHKRSLDAYDAVCTVGAYAEGAIRCLERLRRLPRKELVVTGLPYWDVLNARCRAHVVDSAPQGEPPVLLLAPSWGEKGFLSLWGSDFIVRLAEAGYPMIIRPHPQSWRVEKEMLERLRRRLAPFPEVTFDDSPDPLESMIRSALLLSDTSAIRMDYAMLTGKPVLTLDTLLNDGDVSDFELSDLPEDCMDSLADLVFKPIRKTEDVDIAVLVEQALKGSGPDLLEFKAKHVANFGTAGKQVAEWLITKNAALMAESAAAV